MHNVSRAECSMKRADARSTGHEGGNVGERASKKEKERERRREGGGSETARSPARTRHRVVETAGSSWADTGLPGQMDSGRFR